MIQYFEVVSVNQHVYVVNLSLSLQIIHVLHIYMYTFPARLTAIARSRRQVGNNVCCFC